MKGALTVTEVDVKTYSMNPVDPKSILWIGAEPPPGQNVGHIFDVLVLAAMEIQDDGLYPGVARIMKVPLNDDGTPPTSNEVYMAMRAGIKVAEHIKKGRNVLCTCHLGLNRSALVASLALRNLGWGPDKTILAVRQARGDNALRNRWFEEIIRAY